MNLVKLETVDLRALPWAQAPPDTWVLGLTSVSRIGRMAILDVSDLTNVPIAFFNSGYSIVFPVRPEEVTRSLALVVQHGKWVGCDEFIPTAVSVLDPLVYDLLSNRLTEMLNQEYI